MTDAIVFVNESYSQKMMLHNQLKNKHECLLKNHSQRLSRGVVMKEANKITEGALLTAIYIVLLLVVIFVPFIFIFGLFMLPIPFVVYAKRHSYEAAIVMFFVASGLTMLVATAVSLPITVLAGIGGITMGTALYRERNPYETWARGTVGFIAGMLIVILIMQFVLGINVYDQTATFIEESLVMTKAMMETMNFNVEQMAEFAVVEEQMRMLPDLLPASIAIFSLFLALGSLWLSYKVISRVENNRLSFPPFRKFSLPQGIVWVYMVALFMLLFISNKDGVIYIAALNATMLMIVLVIIQGFSFIFFYASYQQWPRAIPVIIVIVSFLIPFLSMIIVQFIGIIDILLDIKGRIAQTDEK